jgi:hypothetical protein
MRARALLVSCFAVALAVRGEAEDDAWKQARPGLLRCTLAEGRRVSGVLQATQDDLFRLRDAQGQILDVRRSDVSRLEVGRKRTRQEGFRRGFIVGAAIAGGAPFVYYSVAQGLDASAAVVLYGAAGGLVGGLIGGAVPGVAWSPSADSLVALSVTPVARGAQISLRASF